jgi:hypothetical protein
VSVAYTAFAALCTVEARIEPAWPAQMPVADRAHLVVQSARAKRPQTFTDWERGTDELRREKARGGLGCVETDGRIG